MRGVRAKGYLFGDVTSKSVFIPCIRNMLSMSIRGGVIIDAIKFHTINRRNDDRTASGWLGGKGGRVTQLLLNERVESITGTVSKFGEVNCISSLNVPKSPQSIDTVSVRSRRKIKAVVLYCKVMDKVCFFKNFDEQKRSGIKKTDSDVNNGETKHTFGVFDDRYVQCRETTVLLQNSIKPMWSIEFSGSLADLTIKTVDAKGHVYCFSV